MAQALQSAALREAKPLPTWLWSSQVDAILLDCDGTLVDSDPAIDQAVAIAATQAIQRKRRCFRHTAAQNKARFRGRTYQEILAILAREEDVVFEPDELALLYAGYEALKIATLSREARPTPGVEAILRQIRQMGKDLAVVSSSSLPAIRACLQSAKLTGFFQSKYLFSASDSLGYFSQKPEPEIYLHAMDVLGIHPEQGVPFEDSSSGIKAAVAAGFPVVAAYGGCLSPDEQPQHEAKCRGLGATVYMRHWEELVEN